MARARRRPEANLQRAVVQYLSVALGPRTFFTHIAHGHSDLGARKGGILKSMGLVAGIPDIVLWWRDGHGKSFCMGIELKSAAGRISVAQRDTHRRMADAGVLVVTCRSLDDVRATLNSGGVPSRDRFKAY